MIKLACFRSQSRFHHGKVQGQPSLRMGSTVEYDGSARGFTAVEMRSERRGKVGQPLACLQRGVVYDSPVASATVVVARRPPREARQ